MALNEDKDMDMLISVDAALTDDNILGSTLFGALEQLQLSSRLVISFLMQVLSHRIILPDQRGLSDDAHPGLLDLRPLSLPGWRAVTDIAASVLKRGLDSPVVSEWGRDIEDPMNILLSYSRHPLPTQHFTILATCLEERHWPACSRFLVSRISSASQYIPSCVQLLRQFSGAFKHRRSSTVIPNLTRFMAMLFGEMRDHTALWDIIDRHSNIGPDADELWRHLIIIITDYSSRVTSTRRDRELSDSDSKGFQNGLCALLSIPVPSSSTTEFCATFGHLCNATTTIDQLLLVVANL